MHPHASEINGVLSQPHKAVVQRWGKVRSHNTHVCAPPTESSSTQHTPSEPMHVHSSHMLPCVPPFSHYNTDSYICTLSLFPEQAPDRASNDPLHLALNTNADTYITGFLSEGGEAKGGICPPLEIVCPHWPSESRALYLNVCSCVR